MSDLTLFKNSQVPAFATQGKSAAASGLFSAVNDGIKRISIKGGAFRLIAGGKELQAIEDRYLDVVVVNAAPTVSRTYYKDSFQEGSKASPICWSSNGDTPDKAVAKPQCESCAKCPQNVKGSGNGDSKACRFSQRLAVVLANDIEGEVLGLTLPATSIWGVDAPAGMPLSNYAKQLKARGIDPAAVVTRMKFDINSTAPKLLFSPVRFATEQEYTGALAQGETLDAKTAIVFNPQQREGGEEVTTQAAPTKSEDPPFIQGEPPAAPRRPGRPSKQAVETVVEEGDAVVVEEPVVKPVTKAPAAPRSDNLAKLVAEWDDE